MPNASTLSLFSHVAVAVSLVAAAPAAGRTMDAPENLIVDVRVFEARSLRPDFQAMRDLSFFIATDGSDVTERQWLATIARKVPDSFLATLVFDSRPVEGPTARFAHEKRSRELELRVDVSGFDPAETFASELKARLSSGDRELRSFEQPIELRLGQTFVLSGPELELSASDYLSHFRDYDDRDHRGLLYESLRDYTVFLILAVTPRLGAGSGAPAELETVSLELPPETELPELESPMPVALVGTVELGFLVDENGAPTQVRVLRSSVPEVNPRLVGEAPSWRFEEAAGKRGRIALEVRAEP